MTALTNLQGAFDEGFVTKPEYEKRRKALLDGATTFASEMEDETGGGVRKKGSVFDRMGAVNASGGSSVQSGQWDHSGFTQLYGKGAARAGTGKGAGKSGVAKTIGKKTAKTGTLSARFAADVYQAPKGDLRAKLSGNGAKKTTAPGQRKSLPAKCPW